MIRKRSKIFGKKRANLTEILCTQKNSSEDLTVPRLQDRTGQQQPPRNRMSILHTSRCFQEPRLQTNNETEKYLKT